MPTNIETICRIGIETFIQKTRSHLRGTVCTSICPSVRILHLVPVQDNVSQFLAWITKFAPNMHPPLVLKMKVTDLDLQCQFGYFDTELQEKMACLHNKLSQIWSETTKFAPNMHPGILLAGIENGGYWPWSSSSFWSVWRRILGNLVCPCDTLLWIRAKIITFAPNMHYGILLAGIEIVLDLQGHFQETAFNVALL